MTDESKEPDSFFKNSALYQEFLAEREEILKHKWIESEKAGTDIGFEKALLDWIVKHRAEWRASRARFSSSPVIAEKTSH
jgi:hypothetical protein